MTNPWPRSIRLFWGTAFLTLLHVSVGFGQRPVTLHEAIDSALLHGPRAAIARADSTAAAARLTIARAYPNPQAAIGYSKSPPSYHAEVEQEIEYPFLRAARIQSARASALVSSYGLAAERATIVYDVEIAYATAAATLAIRTLSLSNAQDALELLRITRERESIGDASRLDVDLASVAAGQAYNQAATDSLEAIIAQLRLQTLMGMSLERAAIVPVDTQDFALAPSPAPAQLPAQVAAAEQQLIAEQANLRAAQRARIPNPSLRAGVEWHDPDLHGLLPTVGIALPLPFWNRRKGPVEEAQAATHRAQAALDLIRLETQAALALSTRERDIMRAKVARGRTIVEEAQRVAALSLTAYREGEYGLAAVLEAQRNSRDAVRQFIQDVQSSRMAEAAFVRAQVVGGVTP